MPAKIESRKLTAGGTLLETFQISNGELLTSLSPTDIQKARENSAKLWINLQAPTDEEMNEILSRCFNFHPLTIEDCKHASKYPKFDVLSGYSFTVLLSPKTTIPSHAEFFMRELDIYLLPNIVVTVHRESLQTIQRLRDHLINGDLSPLEAGTDKVLHMLIDTIVDRYLTSAKEIEERSDRLERLASKRLCPAAVIEEVLDLRYSAAALAHIVEQTREVIHRMRFETVEERSEQDLYAFSDLNDHLMRASGSLEMSADRLESAHDAFRANQARHRNDLLTMLVIVTASFGLFHFLEFLPKTLAAVLFGLIVFASSAYLLRNR